MVATNYPLPLLNATDAENDAYIRNILDILKAQLLLLHRAHRLSPHDIVDGLRQKSAKIRDEVLYLPRRRGKRDHLARAIAERLYPAPTDSMGPIIKYEQDVIWLRFAVLEHRRRDASDAHARHQMTSWSGRIRIQGPWDEVNDPLPLTGAPALPMPVELSDTQSLTPFFKHLSDNGTDMMGGLDGAQHGKEPYYDVHLLEYEKGVLYSDGRLDLCKKVVGPHNIGALMDALRTNTFTKHFLLGNNVIGPAGAQAISRFIHDIPDKFETWYLAGNCIDTEGFRLLVDAMVKSSSITNVWLKRNPLGSAAARDVFRLITGTKNLRTLDLDQTEIGDDGAAILFDLLADYASSHANLSLENIYLNACGLGAKAIRSLARFLAADNCSLIALYISDNPIGDSVADLANGLAQNRSLQRLVLQSTGLKDKGVISLLGALQGHASLQVLDIGQAYATQDLGMRYNWITDESVPAIEAFISASPRLEYFDLASVAITPSGSFMSDAQDLKGLNRVNRAVAESHSLLWFSAKSIFETNVRSPTTQYAYLTNALKTQVKERLAENVEARYNGMSYDDFHASEKRFLVSPRDVRLIDSVYRNRDAGLARRGLKQLDKWWKEDDPTLAEVQAVGA